MQLFLMRLTPGGFGVSDRPLQGKKIFVFHIALVGQAAYIHPIINELIMTENRISI